MLLSASLRDVAAVALAILLVSRGASAASRPVAVLAAAFIGVNIAAALASEAAGRSLSALAFMPYGALAGVGAAEVVAFGGGRRLGVVLCGITAGFAGDCLWQRAAGTSWLGATPVGGRSMGDLLHPTNVSLLPLLVPLSLGLMDDRGLRGRVLDAAVLLAVGTAVVFSGTRAAWLGFVICGLSIPWIRGRRLRWNYVVAIVLLSAIVGAASASTGPRRLISPAAYERDQRLLQWRTAWRLFTEAPVLGQGPLSFHALCESRHGEAPYQTIDLRSAPYPHDIYLEAAAGTGCVGLVALLVALSQPLVRLRAGASAPLRGAIASSAAFAAIGLVDMSLAKDWVNLCLWLPVGVASASGEIRWRQVVEKACAVARTIPVSTSFRGVAMPSVRPRRQT